MKNNNAGCAKCGLIGCDCHVLEDAFANLCKKCRCDPCACPGKTVTPPATVMNTLSGSQVCAACRRAVCICESHVAVKTVFDAPARLTTERPVRPFTEPYLAVLKNEAMNYYYNRDPQGLVQWLDRVLR